MTGWLAMRPMHLRAFALGMSVSAAALAQVEQGIYTCIDGKGRRLTSDRPIAECNDREQQQLNPSGTVRRRITPPPTAQELAAQEERARREAEERARVAEEKRRDRALLIRYPNKETHDRELVDLLRVGLALAGLHDLAHQRVEGLVLARRGTAPRCRRWRQSPRR
jgi:hypothetical protein